MLTPAQIAELRTKIETKIDSTKDDIEALKELTKPISPENSIGRISRMDAINNKSVNEAALFQAEQRLTKLNYALDHLNDSGFGVCIQCGNDIQYGRLLFRPESVHCMSCAKK